MLVSLCTETKIMYTYLYQLLVDVAWWKCYFIIVVVCTDCPITGQEYNEVSAHCPKTCSNPHLLCAGEGEPGCSCPLGQVIDEINNRCVQPKDCPSKEMNERRQKEEVKCFLHYL